VRGHGPLAPPNGAVMNSDHRTGSGKAPSLVRRAASDGFKTPVGTIAENIAPQTPLPPMPLEEEW